MKKQTKCIIREILIFIVAGSLIQYLFFKDYIIKIDLMTNVVTFLSIVFGFYITSFSIFSTSAYVSGLYQITDKENKTQTLLDALIFKYKIGLIAALFSIFYFILIIFFLNQSEIVSFYLSNKFLYPIISIFLFNFYYGYKMFEILVRVIKQESKHKK